MVNITSNEKDRKPKLNIKHMEHLDAIKEFSNNVYKIKAKIELMTYCH